MTTQMKNLISMCLPLTLTAIAACSSNSGQTPDAGTGGAGGGADGGPFALQPFTTPPANPPAKSILFAASGEALAFSGYAFRR
jgi:hypothetical protein